MSQNTTEFFLRMEGITKRFGPVTALSDVTFAVRRGTVCALCGENGAGKSTLMKVLSGVYQPDGGKIFLDGKEKHFSGPKDALQAGISMLYQEVELAGHLTVYENVFLGREPLRGGPFQCIDTAAEIQKVRELIEANHFQLDPMATVAELSPGQCQLVELLKAMLSGARLIVMDEPTSALSEGEAATLFQIIHRLKAQGITIIYISHRLEEVLALADDICVLRDGAVVFGAPAAELTVDTLVKHMVGRELSQYYPPRESKPGEVVFEARHLTTKHIHDVSFQVRAGEIVGMAGLVGAGRSETAQAIFGIDALLSGECLLHGEKLSVRNPTEAIAAGIGFLTEDRKRTGLCTELPCSWNITLPNYERLDMGKILSLARERKECLALGKKMRLKWRDPEDPASSLSGRNQQKVLVSRWLQADSEFLIVDEPTRGIDVGAKAEIYALLNDLAASGKAILMISSELPEILGMCDRVLVMREGRLTADLLVAKATAEEVMHFAAV
ncbi:MAG: sugar ABC transporter ATP-binding protein [Victivallales bacterium]|nr:sugar ABC transporter ATP-binding protein [Victivallales bacterium]